MSGIISAFCSAPEAHAQFALSRCKQITTVDKDWVFPVSPQPAKHDNVLSFLGRARRTHKHTLAYAENKKACLSHRTRRRVSCARLLARAVRPSTYRTVFATRILDLTIDILGFAAQRLRRWVSHLAKTGFAVSCPRVVGLVTRKHYSCGPRSSRT